MLYEEYLKLRLGNGCSGFKEERSKIKGVVKVAFSKGKKIGLVHIKLGQDFEVNS